MFSFPQKLDLWHWYIWQTYINEFVSVTLRNLDITGLWNGTRLAKHWHHILTVQEGRMYLFPNYQSFPVMYHFNFGDCSFYWTVHLESPSTKHTGSPTQIQIFILRLVVFSWTIICICSVLPKQRCRPHTYIHLLRTYQKLSVSRDITLNATWLYIFNKQWTLYSNLHSKSTYFKFYNFVLRLKVKA